MKKNVSILDTNNDLDRCFTLALIVQTSVGIDDSLEEQKVSSSGLVIVRMGYFSRILLYSLNLSK